MRILRSPDVFSSRDVVAPDGWKPIVERIPGAAGQPHVILEGGGHVGQEDIPVALSDALVGWLGPATESDRWRST